MLKSIKKIKFLKDEIISQWETKETLQKVRVVFLQTLESADNFLQLYHKSRKGKTGTTTHTEQDMLRAMLLFACAGLDSAIKHIIADNLFLVIKKDANAQREFEKYVEKKLKKNSEQSDILAGNGPQINYKFISEVIASNKPKDLLVRKLIESLIENSLQSLDQILVVASHFAITSKELLGTKEVEVIKNTFKVRNSISHEMDIDLTGKSHKNRKERTCNIMLKHTENIIFLCFNFIKAVDERISKK